MERIRNLLILRGGALGDFLLTLPVVAALHRQWPSVPIDLVADSRFADLSIGSGWVRKVHSLDAALMAQLYVSEAERDPALAESLRGYDAVLCYLDDSAQTIAQTLEQAGIRRQVFTSPRVIHGHAVDHFMGALRELGVEMKRDDSVVVRLRPEVERAAIAVRLSEPGVFAVIHPGSGSARKNWPLDRFVGLADRIRREMAIRPVFILGEAEEGLELVLRKAAPSVLCLAKLELMDVAAILNRAQFYIGNDSGITHLAASLGVPTWALFGPTDPAQWAPRGLRVQVVRSSERELHPMEDLAEDTVWQALKAKNGEGLPGPGGDGSPRL
jgi:heptosyltransferase-3